MTRRLAVVVSAALLCLSLLDWLTTHLVLAGGGVEVNPAARALISRGLLLPAKIALPLVMGGILWRSTRAREAMGTAVLWCTAVYAAVVTWNLGQLAL